MKNTWLSAVVLAVSLAVSACGPTQEQLEMEQGGVEQQLPQCDENGQCPTGFYCVGGAFGTCRPGAVEGMPYMCTTEGLCPKGYYCDGGPGGICRRELAAQLYPCTDEGLCPRGYYCDGSACRREIILAE